MLGDLYIDLSNILTFSNLVLLLILQFLILFLVSRKLKVRLIRFIFKVTKSRRAAIYVFSVMFLPGTYLHEIAHYMFALILGVNAGQLELVPEVNGSEIKLGSVKIARTDPIRRFFIGVAPVILGLFIIFFSIFFSYEEILSLNYVIIAIVFYVVFEISNTLFASRSDLANFWEFGLILVFFGGIIYYFDWSFNLDLITYWNNQYLLDFLKIINLYLLLPILVDMIVIFTIWLFEKVYDILNK